MSIELDSIKKEIVDESISWPKILALKEIFSPRLFDKVNVDSSRSAITRGIKVVGSILKKSVGLNLQSNAGHGGGHLVRDYIHALTMVDRLDVDPRHKFIGFVGGSLHDLGCNLIERYNERNKALRHAEAGALFVSSLLGTEVNDAERNLIAHSIAAHTHYRDSFKVIGEDSVEREITPYQDMEGDKPILGIWIPR